MTIPISYKEQYIFLHGYEDLIPERWFPFKKGQTAEDVYKDAIQKETTWRKMTNWNGDRGNKEL